MNVQNHLHPNDIVLGLPTVSVEEAIAHAGRLLANRGYVNKGYTATMLAREKQISTFIGQGTMIPHGISHDPLYINKTGLVVLQYPDGIIHQGERCHVIIGISSTSDEHLAILQYLATLLQNRDIATTLWTTTDKSLAYQLLCKEGN